MGAARNVEIKARVAHLSDVRAKAAALTMRASEVFAQTDTFFVAPHGRLKVREFADGSGELIAYERADSIGPKESVYTRVPCESAQLLARALGSALPVLGRVVKRREVFLVGRTRVHLDDVSGLGTFIELEVVLGEGEPFEAGERDARQLMQALGIPASALVAGAYIDLLIRAAGGLSHPV